MTIPPWTKRSKERAKKEGRYLVKLQVQGKHAGRGDISFSGDVGEKIAFKFIELIGKMIVDQVKDARNE